MFDLLGASPDVYASPPVMTEILDWLDRYLGPGQAK
jgi:hypothetical protein